MKKILLAVALVAFLGGGVTYAVNVSDNTVNTEIEGEKKEKKEKKSKKAKADEAKPAATDGAKKKDCAKKCSSSCMGKKTT